MLLVAIAYILTLMLQVSNGLHAHKPLPAEVGKRKCDGAPQFGGVLVSVRAGAMYNSEASPMGIPRYLLGSLFAVAVVGTAGASDKTCALRYRDIDTMTKVSDTMIVVRTRRAKTFELTFTGSCRYDDVSGQFFNVRMASPWECLRSGGNLPLSRGNQCFIKSIREVTKDQTAN
jgi:hypothetical protein